MFRKFLILPCHIESNQKIKNPHPAGLSMGFSLRMGFEKKIGGDACGGGYTPRSFI
jgi:hypothetical protein